MLKINKNEEQKKVDYIVPPQGCGCKKKADNSNISREKKLQELQEKMRKIL